MRRDHVLQFVLEAAQTPDFQGVTAQAVADALSIWRNDAAVELNKLVAEGKLRRVGKKNVRFFPASEETADIRPEPAVQEEPPQAEEETGQYRAFSGLVGADGSLKYQLRVAMAAVAYPPNGLNMLITGSTGSGKSHFARTIWEYAKETKALCGAHAPIPFVEFNCAEYADNPQLLLSHLFGYKKGAFTGALEDKPGLVEQANGGILFLDEIHGLSSTGQEMFFSLLDTGVFRRVGDNTPRTSRFMLIGATTKPLTDLLETFLRRMPVLISMPTLSDRPMKERLELVAPGQFDELKFDLIGCNSLYWNPDYKYNEPSEVRVRVAGRAKTKAIADLVPNEVEALYTNGPAGGCGAVKRTRDIVSVASILVSRYDVKPEAKIFVV